MTAFVFEVILSNKDLGHRLSVLSISPHTGVARDSIIASTVATKVKLWVITSSPSLISKAANATLKAAVPEETAKA